MARIWIAAIPVLLMSFSAIAAEQSSSEERSRPSTASEPSRSILRRPAERAPTPPKPESAPSGESTRARPFAFSGPMAETIPVLKQTEGQAKPQRLVYRLKSMPATEVASTLNRALRGEPPRAATPGTLAIVADAVSNCIIFSGPTEAVQEAMDLAEQLDRPAAMVEIEVVIADGSPDEKPEHGNAKPPKEKPKASAAKIVEKPEEMQELARARLTTLDNQKAHLHIGGREPRITGASMTPMGRSNSISMENFGTIVTMTPRVSGDGTVTLDLDVEDSRLGPPSSGTVMVAPKDGDPIRTPGVETLMTKTTLRIADGQTLILSGVSRQAPAGKQRLILVTAHLLRMDGKAVGKR